MKRTIINKIGDLYISTNAFRQKGFNRGNLKKLVESELEIRAPKESELGEMFYQRWYIVNHPLGLPKSSGRDKLDQNNLEDYIVIIKDKKLLASARLTVNDEIGDISWMAISVIHQGLGLGTKIMKFIIKKAKEKKLKILTTTSRKCTVDFYKKFGFTSQGEFFKKPGIKLEYIRMKLKL